jgi:hypothetical protein
MFLDNKDCMVLNPPDKDNFHQASSIRLDNYCKKSDLLDRKAMDISHENGRAMQAKEEGLQHLEFQSYNPFSFPLPSKSQI